MNDCFFTEKNKFLHLHFDQSRVEVTRIGFNTKLPKNKQNKDQCLQIKLKKCSELFHHVMHNFLKAQNIYDESKEIIDDISLIIGGSHVQDPHFDHARMFSSFDNEQQKAEVNHELNRNEYNKAIMSQYGHSSILSGFDDAGFMLCIPSCYVIINEKERTASMKYGGVIGEEFSLYGKEENYVSHNHDGKLIPYITIKVPKNGIQFVGDFAHCGAVAIEEFDRSAKGKYRTFFEKACRCIDNSNYAALYALLENYKLLHKITRLFVSVKPKEFETLIVDNNNVEFFSKDKCEYVEAPNEFALPGSDEVISTGNELHHHINNDVTMTNTSPTIEISKTEKYVRDTIKKIKNVSSKKVCHKKSKTTISQVAKIKKEKTLKTTIAKRKAKTVSQNKIAIPPPYNILVAKTPSAKLIMKQQKDMKYSNFAIKRERSLSKLEYDRRYHQNKRAVKRGNECNDLIKKKKFLFYKKFQDGKFNLQHLYADNDCFRQYFDLDSYENALENKCNLKIFNPLFVELSDTIKMCVSMSQGCRALEVNHEQNFEDCPIIKLRNWQFDMSFEEWTHHLKQPVRCEGKLPLVEWLEYKPLSDIYSVIGCFAKRDFLNDEVIALFWGKYITSKVKPTTFAFSNQYGTYDALRGFYGNGKAVFNMGVHMMRTLDDVNDINNDTVGEKNYYIMLACWIVF